MCPRASRLSRFCPATRHVFDGKKTPGGAGTRDLTGERFRPDPSPPPSWAVSLARSTAVWGQLIPSPVASGRAQMLHNCSCRVKRSRVLARRTPSLGLGQGRETARHPPSSTQAAQTRSLQGPRRRSAPRRMARTGKLSYGKSAQYKTQADPPPVGNAGALIAAAAGAAPAEPAPSGMKRGRPPADPNAEPHFFCDEPGCGASYITWWIVPAPAQASPLADC